MINEFKDNPTRESGVIVHSVFEQIKMLYEQDKQKAGELAISAIEMALTGDISSDDFTVKLVLKNFEVITEKNHQKYDKKVEVQKQSRIDNLKLVEIAELHSQGMKQAEIAKQLGFKNQQDVSYRLKIIREEFPYLINKENTKIQKIQKVHTNDNINDNDNNNDNNNNNPFVPHNLTVDNAMRKYGY